MFLDGCYNLTAMVDEWPPPGGDSLSEAYEQVTN